MAEPPTSPPGGSHESGGEQSPITGGAREQDRFLPIANISRIMKKALPANGKIAKDAKDTVQECVSEFISFVTSECVFFFFFSFFLLICFRIVISGVLVSIGLFCFVLFCFFFFFFFLCRASDKCQKEKRKTINGDDLLWAMATLGFEEYIDPLKSYLTRYREVKLFLIFSFSFCFTFSCTSHLDLIVHGHYLCGLLWTSMTIAIRALLALSITFSD